MGKFAEQVGSRIREIRKQKGLRQEDMEGFGLSYKYYQKIERGKTNVTLETIEKIAAALDISPFDLFRLPLGKSPEVNELAGHVTEIIRKNDRARARKLNVVIKEVLR